MNILYTGRKEMVLRGWQVQDVEKRGMSEWSNITEEMSENGP